MTPYNNDSVAATSVAIVGAGPVGIEMAIALQEKELKRN